MNMRTTIHYSRFKNLTLAPKHRRACGHGDLGSDQSDQGRHIMPTVYQLMIPPSFERDVRSGGRTTHRVPENKILFKKLKSCLNTIVIIKQKTGEHV